MTGCGRDFTRPTHMLPQDFSSWTGSSFACSVRLGGGKAVYLCGHSLGGGLVSMLSLILPTRWALSVALLLCRPRA